VADIIIVCIVAKGKLKKNKS